MPMTHAKTPPTRRGFALQEFKALDEQHGTFSGYLAVFNNVDDGDDLIEPGAFAKTIVEAKTRQQRRADAGAPSGRYLWPIYWVHTPNEPVGGFTDAREDANGLYVEAELDLDIEPGRRAYSGLAKGYVANMSIGYFPVKRNYDKLGVRHLKEVGVFEGSVCAVGMNEEALVLQVKSTKDTTKKNGMPPTGRKGAAMPPKTNQQRSQQRPAHLPQGKATDFTTTLTGMMQGDTLQREWAKTFDAFVKCVWNGLLDAKYPPYTPDGETADDPAEALDATVDAFTDAVKDLIKRSIAAAFYPQLDNDADSFADPDDESEGGDAVYMSRDTSGAETKRGAVMSAANHKALGAMVAQAKSLHAGMKAFHAKMSATTEPDGGDADTTQSGEDETNGKDGKSLNGAGQHNMAGTTPQGNEDEDEAARMQAMIADMQLFIRARTEAAAAAH